MYNVQCAHRKWKDLFCSRRSIFLVLLALLFLKHVMLLNSIFVFIIYVLMREFHCLLIQFFVFIPPRRDKNHVVRMCGSLPLLCFCFISMKRNCNRSSQNAPMAGRAVICRGHWNTFSVLPGAKQTVGQFASLWEGSPPHVVVEHSSSHNSPLTVLICGNWGWCQFCDHCLPKYGPGPLAL